MSEFTAKFTAEEIKLIYEALRHSRPTHSYYPEPRERHAEAMKIVANELQNLGVFPTPKIPGETQ